MDGSLDYIRDYHDGKECFGEDVDIAGGVSYWLWGSKRDKSLPTSFSSNTNTWKVDLKDFKIVIRDSVAVTVFNKIVQSTKNLSTFDEIVRTTDTFGVKRDRFGSRQIKDSEHQIYLQHSKNEHEYISINDIQKNSDKVNYYKLVTEYMNGSDNKILRSLSIYNPGEICDLSFIVIAMATDLDTITRIKKYFGTKFTRFLIKSTLVNTTATRSNYQLVPIQQFGKGSDIDWSGDIDEQLYKKYNLSKEEINHIESTIETYDIQTITPAPELVANYINTQVHEQNIQ